MDGLTARQFIAAARDGDLERGADPAEADAQSWARPRAWADKMHRTSVSAVLRGYLPG